MYPFILPSKSWFYLKKLFLPSRSFLFPKDFHIWSEPGLFLRYFFNYWTFWAWLSYMLVSYKKNRCTGLCDRCPSPPSPSACSRISCSKHNWTVPYVLFVLKLYLTYHKYDLFLMMHDPQLNINFDYYWQSEIPLRQREVFYDWGNFLFLFKVKKL